ncbi:phenazine biosynthesis protein PhzF [Ktedonobacter sp. SOSP1-52]|uniref:PhzF family phenazine biosynthesis protein n=1 Tax=Ktedonobacter sp. SOSP1-52 TaxID=2778366 RepID=UPI0019160D6A|nr:PhzF family phenazine biosynthesis protein [Ktedonobacter sp. SOSP1-52]GHO70828.1 phenazine biosynthesis protein PhzF [Ktedonobacter sp. SOSP1-52]
MSGQHVRLTMTPFLAYYHVDVFSARSFTGNSLTVFPASEGLNREQMQRITQEMHHFESIFLCETPSASTVKAHVFDLQEELEFAGHPLLGAASVLHELNSAEESRTWNFILPQKTVQVTTRQDGNHYHALLDQGQPTFFGEVEQGLAGELLTALNLTPANLAAELPLEVISTGLRYLIVPIRQGLAHARIVHPAFEELLAKAGAQFAYVLDVPTLEGRHWNNDGRLEDVATGSAAGTVGAYLVKHGLVQSDQDFLLHQGRFTGRPSQMLIRIKGQRDAIQAVLVGGDVSLVAQGRLLSLPGESVNRN